MRVTLRHGPRASLQSCAVLRHVGEREEPLCQERREILTGRSSEVVIDENGTVMGPTPTPKILGIKAAFRTRPTAVRSAGRSGRCLIHQFNNSAGGSDVVASAGVDGCWLGFDAVSGEAGAAEQQRVGVQGFDHVGAVDGGEVGDAGGQVLGLDVNVGVAAVAGFVDSGDRLAFGEVVTGVDGDAVLAEVADHQVGGSAGASGLGHWKPECSSESMRIWAEADTGAQTSSSNAC